jgi:hypothetical protein
MRSIEDLEILTLRRQEEYFNYLYNGTLTSRVDFQPFYGSHPMLLQGTDLAGIRRRDRLADLAAVRFVVIPVASMRSAEVRDYVEGAGYGLRARDGDLVLLENPRALPRAFVTYRVAPAPEVETLLAILSAEDFDPLAMSYVEGLAERSPDASAPKSGAAAQIVVDLDRVVEVDAKLDAPGFVVLADSFYPGWTAEVDGEPAEIHPTNHLFRGVEVPAGHHTVRFEYEPSSFRIGALASVTGVLMLAVVALRSRRG